MQGFQQAGEGAFVVDFGEQADVFGEHGEQAAREEGGDALGLVFAFERLGDAGEADGDFARGAGGAAGRVEAVRVLPDGLEAGADFRLAEVVEPDAVAARIGEGRVAAAGAGEFGVELDDVADIEDDEEGRPAFIGGQVAGVVFGLATGAQQGVVEPAGFGAGADFLGFADEAAASVAVDEAVAGAAVAVMKDDAALEDVGVVAGVFVGGLGWGDFQQGAEVGDEELVIGALGAAGRPPAGEEGVDLHDGTLTLKPSADVFEPQMRSNSSTAKPASSINFPWAASASALRSSQSCSDLGRRLVATGLERLNVGDAFKVTDYSRPVGVGLFHGLPR